MKKYIKKMLIIIFIAVLIISILILYISSGVVSSEKLLTMNEYNYPEKKNVNELSTLKLMTYNCGYFSGMKNNTTGKYEKNFISENIKNFIRIAGKYNPDIVSMQEIDFNSSRSFEINQSSIIAKMLNFRYVSNAVNWNKKYVPYPYWPPSAHFKKILSGQSIFSKFPILSQTRVVLEKPENNFLYNLFYIDRLIHIAKIKVSDIEVLIFNVHLEAFDIASRESQAKKLVKILNEKKNRYPMIVTGDFNSVPMGAKKKRGFSDEPKTDYRNDKTLNILSKVKFLNCVFPIDESFTENEATFPSNYPDRKLDYIFYTPAYFELKKKMILLSNSSDHLPVFAEFILKKNDKN